MSGRFVVVSECLKTLADVAAADDARGVVGGMACPVAVEVVRYFADDAAGSEDIQVGENGVLTDFEVFVADIASAEYGGAVVGGKGFVVHAAVEAGEVSQVAECAPFAEDEGVEQAHFDIGMAVEGEQEVVQSARVVVVQQQAYAHTAFCGKVHEVEQQSAGNVVAPDVVLQIEAVFGRFDKGGAGGKGFVGVVQQIDIG